MNERIDIEEIFYQKIKEIIVTWDEPEIYAFWRQDEIAIVDTAEENDGAELLFKWYAQNNMKNIGFEDDENEYDKSGEYIGKGPVGQYELAMIAANVANRLQREGVIAGKFGQGVPIIVHGLEYAWYDIEATKRANPNCEADVFLEHLKESGMIP